MKFWGNWSYWIKGGIIGFLTPIVFIPLGFSPIGFITGLLIAPAFYLLKLSLVNNILKDTITSKIEGGFVYTNYSLLIPLAVILSPFFWCIIGITTGAIYDKIKNRKKAFL